MRELNPVKFKLQGPPPVLLLGRGSVADRIKVDLEMLGFHVVREEVLISKLPEISDPDLLPKLNTIFKKFADQYQEKALADGSQPATWKGIHPGVSPYAHCPEISAAAKEAGLVFFGPSIKVLNLFSNKLNLLAQADKLGIPHLVQSFDPIRSYRECLRWIEKETALRKGAEPFPLVFKAIRNLSAQGSIRVIHDFEELEREFPIWLEQLRSTTGESIVFIEKFWEGVRQVIVPFVRFQDSRVVLFPKVDCSLQYHYRKLIDLMPAQGLSDRAQEELHQHTRNLLRSSGYVGAGFLEFLVDDSRVFFIGGSPRLSSIYWLWEKLLGTRWTSWQVASTLGEEWPVLDARVEELDSHLFELAPIVPKVAMCMRVYAEDPFFSLPQPGVVHELEADLEEGSEFMPEVYPGQRLTHSSSGLIGVLGSLASEESQLWKVAAKNLNKLWIAGGIQTNEQLLKQIVNNTWVKEGIYHAGAVDEEFVPQVLPSQTWIDTAVQICASLTDEKVKNWRVGPVGAELKAGEVIWREGPISFDVGGVSGTIEFEGQDQRVCIYPLSSGMWQVRIGSWFERVRFSHLTQKRRLYAQVSGRVHSVHFLEGAITKPDEPLIVLESMYQLIPHRLPIPARIVKLHVRAEQEVQVGDVMAELELQEGSQGAKLSKKSDD